MISALTAEIPLPPDPTASWPHARRRALVTALFWLVFLVPVAVLWHSRVAVVDWAARTYHDDRFTVGDDFRGSYYHAIATRKGCNLYCLKAVCRTVNRDGLYAYYYPPLSFLLYRQFAKLPYPRAYHAYLMLKALALLGVFWLWGGRRFMDFGAMGWGRAALFAGLSLALFNAPVYQDLRMGNVTVYEELFLWLGFWCFVEGRPFGFCLAVMTGSLFKLTPLAFLGLLAFMPGSPWQTRARYAAGTAAAFALVVWGPFLFYPELWPTYVHNIAFAGHEKGGAINPSVFHLIYDWVGPHKCDADLMLPVINALYLAWCALVAAVTAKAIWGLRREWDDPGVRRDILFLACFAYALVMPRFKDYMHMLLVVPACWKLLRLSGPWRYARYAVLFYAVVTVTRLHDYFHVPQTLPAEYAATYLVIGLWVWQAGGLWRRANAAARVPGGAA